MISFRHHSSRLYCPSTGCFSTLSLCSSASLPSLPISAMSAALNIEPGASAFPAAGGASSHQIVSLSESRLAFKVKSSNNEHYRVHPVYGFVAAKSQAKLDIVRKAGPPNDDKLVVQWAEVPEEETDPQAPFKAGAQAGEVVLPLKAE